MVLFSVFSHLHFHQQMASKWLYDNGVALGNLVTPGGGGETLEVDEAFHRPPQKIKYSWNLLQRINPSFHVSSRCHKPAFCGHSEPQKLTQRSATAPRRHIQCRGRYDTWTDFIDIGSKREVLDLKGALTTPLVTPAISNHWNKYRYLATHQIKHSCKVVCPHGCVCTRLGKNGR